MLRKNKFIVLGIATCMFSAAQAVDLDLASARAQNLVCEGTDGYLHTKTQPVTPEVQTLIDNINKQRQTEYQSIANKTSGKIKDAQDAAAVKLIKEKGGC